MRATMLDLRRNTGKIIEAIERNETIILTKRGKEIAAIVPRQESSAMGTLLDDPAIGIWDDREDMADPAAYVRSLRKSRFHGV